MSLAMPAYAQNAPQADEDTGFNDEIVVTAQRQAQSLQDVPIAVSAFSEEALEKQQAAARAQLADGSIYQRDPGLAQQLFKRDAEIDDVLLAAMERWEVLSAR
jgi:outer membrane receptor protein involved in Fe transport